MSSYYSGKRSYGLYQPDSKYPYKLSRSRIENFVNCPRCFYIDRRLGIDAPPGYPFSLNSAVDKLLKKEFDIHRANGSRHPLMETYGIDAIPMSHEMLGEWRDTKRGISYHDKKNNFIIFGGIDDLWIDGDKNLVVVDYKATSKESEVTLDAPWQQGYKRQMEIYQWLFRKNGYHVSDLGYFVYCNGQTDRKAFDGKLEFDVKILPYKGNDSWIDKTIDEIKETLDKDDIPESNPECDFCIYRQATYRIK